MYLLCLTHSYQKHTKNHFNSDDISLRTCRPVNGYMTVTRNISHALTTVKSLCARETDFIA